MLRPRLELHLGDALLYTRLHVELHLGDARSCTWLRSEGAQVDWYKTFVIEEQFGFNKHTWRSWVRVQAV